jgi:hypothetical protein
MLKSTQTKLKLLVAFVQIVINIGFNCNVTFPDVTERFFDKLGIFNFDIVPSLGLSCRFPSFDYVSRMIIVTAVPLFLALALGIAYCFIRLFFGDADSIKIEKSDEELEAMYGPHDASSEVTDDEDENPVRHHTTRAHRRETLQVLTDEDLVAFRRVFYYVDKDFSGYIDREELRSAFEEFQPDAKSETIDEILNNFFKEAKDSKSRAAEEIHTQERQINFERFALVLARSRREKGSGSSDFVVFISQIKKKIRSNIKTQTIVTLFLLLTFIVLTPTSSTVLHYFKVFLSTHCSM